MHTCTYLFVLCKHFALTRSCCCCRYQYHLFSPTFEHCKFVYYFQWDYAPSPLQTCYALHALRYIIINEWAMSSEKVPSEHVWTAQVQIRLRGGAVWSEPSLFANKIIWHYRTYQWRVEAHMRHYACAGWIWICAFCAYSKTFFRGLRNGIDIGSAAWFGVYKLFLLLNLCPIRPMYCTTNRLRWL